MIIGDANDPAHRKGPLCCILPTSPNPPLTHTQPFNFDLYRRPPGKRERAVEADDPDAKRPKPTETPTAPGGGGDGTLRCLDLPPAQAKNLLENINPHPYDKRIKFRESDHK